MIKNCPICGKAFDVLYPDIWRYKRNNRFLCSWKCIRLFDGKEERQVKERVSVKRTRMSRDDMAEAVRMWKANDPGLDQYLTDHGITHIGKWKQNARDRYGVAAPATAKVDGPLRIETPEAHNVDIVETPEKKIGGLCPPPDEVETSCRVTALDTPIGEFHYDRHNGYIDWDWDNNTMSLTIEEWKEFRKWFPYMLQRLGVRL